jgi:UDP-N-acetylglucosamine 4,6-dehydratase
MELANKKILITGGTGSLGQALTSRLLATDVETVRIYSRNEHNQIQMEQKFADDRLRFFIGDVRDLHRLVTAMDDVDIVIHAAALKHVPVIEYNPFESIKTNVIGTQNVIDACLHENIELAVGVSTDKAVSPLNTYGATKLLTEKLFSTAQNYLNPDKHKTKFCAVRYGNVLGSSGSVIPKFINQIKQKRKITITDSEMTRFSISMEEALDFILDAIKSAQGQEIFVPKKLKAYSIMTLKDALFELLEDTGFEITSVRPGEKMHETLIGPDEMRLAWEDNSKYMIYNSGISEEKIKTQHKDIKKIFSAISHSSDKAEKIPKEELKIIIKNADLLNNY